MHSRNAKQGADILLNVSCTLSCESITQFTRYLFNVYSKFKRRQENLIDIT